MFRLKQPSAGLTSPTKPDLLGDRSPRVFSAFAIFLAVVVAGCGGSGGGGSSSSAGPLAPAGLSYPDPGTLYVGIEMVPVTPNVTDGIADLYSVSPSLPTGLSLDQATGQLSGTPSIVSTQTTHRITASNQAGSTNFDLTLEILSLPVPIVHFESPNSASTEGQPAVTIAVSLSEVTIVPVTCNFIYSGTAEVGVDYSAPLSTLLITPGQTRGILEVSLIDNGLSEEDALLIVTLDAPVNGILGSPSVHTLTIQDDDGISRAEFTNQMVEFPENSGSQVIPLSLVPPSSSPVALSFSLLSTSTATESVDFNIPVYSLTFASGSSSASLPLSLFDDDLFEGNEWIDLEITSVVGADPGTLLNTRVTLLEDDALPGIEFPVSNYVTAESNRLLSIPLTLSSISSLDTTVELTLSGSAEVGVDYMTSNTLFAIPAGVLGSQFTFTPIEDGIDEGVEVATIEISAVSNATIGLNSVVTVSLNDLLTPPCDLQYLEPSAVYGLDSPIQINIPTVGCAGANSFTIQPPLPNGLAMDPLTGVIEGTPTIRQPATSYVVTASNSSGTVSTTITIQVSEVFHLRADSPIVNYDLASGSASFPMTITLVETPTGTPAAYHEVGGFSFGLRFDSDLLIANSAIEGVDSLTHNSGAGADFFMTSLFQDGVTVAAVIDFPQTEFMLASSDLEILVIQFSTVPSAFAGNATGHTTVANFDNTLGEPPMDTLVIHSGIIATVPIQVPGFITLVP